MGFIVHVFADKREVWGFFFFKQVKGTLTTRRKELEACALTAKHG